MHILYRFPEKAKNFVRHFGLNTTISLYRNASLKITSIMKKICKWITAFLNDFYVWNTAFFMTVFHKKCSQFIIIFSRKNALFRNILLLRVRYISILNSLCSSVYPTRQNFARRYVWITLSLSPLLRKVWFLNYKIILYYHVLCCS